MPTARFYQIAAYAVALAATPSARAVIFHSTDDPTFNTTAPTGTLANSGWQYTFDVGEYVGTAVGPNHYLTAAHTGIGVNHTFDYNGVAYTTTQVVADYGDLRLLRVDKPFLSYAPLYDLAPGSEQLDPLVVIGRGTRRGAEIEVAGVPKGWHWGAIDGVRRWGTNHVAGFANNTTLMRFDFDLNDDDNEAVLSDKDSGGAVFIKIGEQWTMAGVNYAVTGPYSIPPDPTRFTAALYDTSGMFNHQTNAPGVGASGAYASMVSPHAANLKNFLNLPPTWKVNSDGNWGTAANWANDGPPGGVDAIADFRTAIAAPRTVTYLGTVAVGTINLDSAHAYTITGSFAARSQLNLDVASGNATINVASGNHTINGVVPQDPTVINVVQPNSTLTLTVGPTPQPITKEGAGAVSVRRLESGVVTVNRGTVFMNANAAVTGTSKVAGVSVATAADAKLDLANNDMVVINTPPGAWNGTVYEGLTGLMAQAYVFSEWTGPGLTSSAAAAGGGLTSLAIAPASDVKSISGSETAVWSGQTVGANDTLIAYTYAGDVNLDGLVDAADYGVIDNWIQFPGTTAYANGDFNYDGVIDAADYGIIDNSIQLQGAPLIPAAAAEFASASATSVSGVSAVPEPAATSLVALASVALLSRGRRRRRRRSM